jgi:uncharacterized protein
MTSADERHVPRPEGVNAEFHTACVASGAVCLQRCADCGRYQHPPRWLCAGCGSPAYEFPPQSGAATCFTAVITHRATSPGWSPPYTTVVAELSAGPRLITAWESDDPPVPGSALLVSVRPAGERFAFFVATRSPRDPETQ